MFIYTTIKVYTLSGSMHISYFKQGFSNIRPLISHCYVPLYPFMVKFVSENKNVSQPAWKEYYYIVLPLSRHIQIKSFPLLTFISNGTNNISCVVNISMASSHNIGFYQVRNCIVSTYAAGIWKLPYVALHGVCMVFIFHTGIN